MAAVNASLFARLRHRRRSAAVLRLLIAVLLVASVPVLEFHSHDEPRAALASQALERHIERAHFGVDVPGVHLHDHSVFAQTPALVPETLLLAAEWHLLGKVRLEPTRAPPRSALDDLLRPPARV